MQRIFNPLMAPWSYNYNSMDGTEVVQAASASPHSSPVGAVCVIQRTVDISSVVRNERIGVRGL